VEQEVTETPEVEHVEADSLEAAVVASVTTQETAASEVVAPLEAIMADSAVDLAAASVVD
jgi:hypothetical protein